MSPVLSRVSTGQGFGSIVSYKRAYLASQGGGGYQVSRSLRFNGPIDNSYLNRTPAVAGNRRTWTWAGWVKRSAIGSGNRTLFDATLSGGGTENPLIIGESVDDTLSFYLYNGSSYVFQIRTTQVFRDPSAWYHILVAVDTTQATASDRVKFFINGIQVITFAVSTYPSLNLDTYINNTTAHAIGSKGSTVSSLFSGYLADVHFIDGQALDPSSFTTTDLTTGQLIPKAYTGSYGTNGFKLNFSDNSTTAALGTDTSGNSNTWTANNLSVTAGSGNDSLVDTPTSYGTDTGAGGEVRGNYATLNPLDSPDNPLSNGNLDLVGAGNSFNGNRSTFGLTAGKWYFECTIVATGGETRTGPGLYRSTDVLVGDYGNGTVVIYDYLGVLYVRDESGAGSTWYSTAGTISASDIFGFAFDLNAQKVWIHQNGTWLNSGNPGAGTGAVVSSLPSETYFPGGWAYNTSDKLTFNFGQRAFAYTAPSGFKALCDTNIAEGTITTSGTFTGNANADGPFVYLNGVPTAMTINSNSITFGTHADKLSNGFKVRNSTSTYNIAGSNTFSVSTTDAKFKFSRAQPNP